MSAEEPVRLTANDFFLGLFAALKLRGQSLFSIRADRFDAAIKDIYDHLEAEAEEANIELRFRVRPHSMYGDSRTVRRALTAAAQRRIISFDNPEYLDIRIQLDESDAERKLERLGVPPALFDELADQFIDAYRQRRETLAG
ncbi:MAG: hypothetical protein JWO63_3041 [Frankiales bacterium]|nr:hypothetical protein [Frankiales bacterium]